MKKVLLCCSLLLPALVWSTETLSLTVQDEYLRMGGWGENVNEYKIYTAEDGLISRIDYRNLQDQAPPYSMKIERSGSRLVWVIPLRPMGKETNILQKEVNRWAGTRRFPTTSTNENLKTVPLLAQWELSGTRLWTDENVSALLLPGHYLEEVVTPQKDIYDNGPLTYDLQGKLLVEKLGPYINSKTTYSRVGSVVKASRLEEPDDGGWKEMGRSTLTGRSLKTKDPAINAANWKILSSVIYNAVYLPFLLDWNL